MKTKRAVCLAMVLFFLSVQPSFSVSLKARIERLENRVERLEEEIKVMPEGNGTCPSDLGIMIDGNDPTVPGDIKVVQQTPYDIHHCDAIDDGIAIWTVQSGAGVTIGLENSNPYEGTGSVWIRVPPNITAIVKTTKSSGNWNLSSYKSLKAHLMVDYRSVLDTFKFYFGEAAYSEQSSSIAVPPSGRIWFERSWDISGILPTTLRDGVTIFAVQAHNPSLTSAQFFWIDYVYAESGPGKVKAFTSEVITIYPPIPNPEMISVFYEDFLNAYLPDITSINLLYADHLWLIPLDGISIISGRNGVIRIAGAIDAIYPYGSDTMLPYVQSKNPEVRISAAQYGTGTATRRMGLGSAVLTADPTNGIYFRHTNAGNYFGVCRSGGVESTLDTGIAAANGVFHTLRMKVTGTTSVEFFVDGSSKGTVTAYIPTASLFLSLGTSSASYGLDVDYVMVSQDR